MAIFSAIATGVATALGLGATAASFIGAGLAVTANLAVSYFTRQREKPPTVQARTAIRQQVQFGADVARFTVYGTSDVKGHLHFYAKWGTGNAYNGFVYKLADGWCDGLEPEVYFYGEKHALVSATPIGNEVERWLVDGYGDLIEFRFYDGRPGQEADAKLVADTAGAERPWLSSSRMTNQTYVIVQAKYDKDKFSRGRPEFKWVLRGLRVYDWRKDSTVTGGSGAHRLSDLATWEHTNNPAILRAAFQMGLKGVASGRTLIGQGKSFGQLHLASYTVAANVADTDREKNGRTFKTYQIGMAVSSEMDHTEVLNDFDDALVGYALNLSGLSGVIVGAPQIPSFALTEKDIDQGRAKDIRWRRETDDLGNHLTGTFTSPASHWSPEPLTPVTVAADVAADKRKRSKPYDFTQIFDPDIGQYNLNCRYRQLRFGGQATIPVMPAAYARAEGGEWCTYAGHTWIVVGKSKKGGPTLTLAETDASVYSEEGIAVGPIITAPTVPAQALPPLVTNLTVQAVVIPGENPIPGLRLSWDVSDDPRIDALVVEYRIQGETEALRATDVSPGDGVLLISGVSGGADYEARAAYITTPAFSTVFGDWEPVRTISVPPQLADESVSFTWLDLGMQGLLARLFAALQEVDRKIEAVTTGGQVERLQTYELGRELSALLASYGESTDAKIIEEAIVRATADEALAARTAFVEASANDATASGLFKIEAQAGSGDVVSRLAYFARATLDDKFEEAGFIVEVVTDGGTPPTLTSRIAMKADQIVLDDGSQPFVFEDGEMKLNLARIKTIIGGRLESANGSSYWDLDNNVLAIGS